MQPFRLGVVNFLNAYPLWAALQHDSRVILVPDVPSRLAIELRAGNLDAALISSVEYLRHPEGFAYHPGLCIAAEAESKSIRLFARNNDVSFREKIAQTELIYTDVASRSSVAQLRVILHELQSSPQLVEVGDPAERIPVLAPGEALLSIGDTALRYMHSPSYDLLTAYHTIFHRGFVYALWVGRDAIMHALQPVLDLAYQQWLNDQEKLLAEAVQRFGFDRLFAEDYLSRIIGHRMTPEHQADLEFFSARFRQL